MSRDEELARLSKDLDARFGDASRARLEELMAMARVSRGWSGRQLAEFLDRDPHNIVPSSGVPKVDLVYRLARALGWSPAAVLEDICGDRVVAASQPTQPTSYAELNRAAYEAFASGRFDEMIAMALRAQAVARTPDERAEACLREAGGWDGLGRYVDALEALQRGLQQRGVSAILLARLRANLAGFYFVLGRVVEGEGVATTALEAFEALDPTAHVEARLVTTGFALYTRGQCRRTRMLLEPESSQRLAVGARRDLEESRRCFAQAVERTRVEAYHSIADTCHGALIVVDALAGRLPVESAIERVLSRLEAATDLSKLAPGYPRENIGWWCIFGCELAAHAVSDRADRERLLAIFTNKGNEVVELSGHWALRERLLVFEYLRRLPEGDSSGPISDPLVLDDDDVRQLVATMGRFPTFRTVGWSLLRTSPRV